MKWTFDRRELARRGATIDAVEARSRVTVAACVLACLVTCDGAPAAGAAAHRADGRLGGWRGHPLTLSGRTPASRGELIYSDWVYDDYGPDLDRVANSSPAKETASLNPT